MTQNQKYHIAIYAQNTACAGHVCQDPDRIYGSNARDTFDLEWYRGTRSSLLADAYEALQRRGSYGVKIYNSIVKNFFESNHSEAQAAHLRRARSLKAASTRRARRTSAPQS